MNSMSHTIIAILVIFGAITLTNFCGCAWPFHQQKSGVSNQLEPAKEQDPKGPWTYIGKGTGFDPRAKDIERRLGYE